MGHIKVISIRNDFFIIMDILKYYINGKYCLLELFLFAIMFCKIRRIELKPENTNNIWKKILYGVLIIALIVLCVELLMLEIMVTISHKLILKQNWQIMRYQKFTHSLAMSIF